METGTIHNPHCIEWMRRNGGIPRDINDVPCGGLIQAWEFDNFMPQNTDMCYKFYAIHRCIAHIDYEVRYTQPKNNFDDLRRDYVLGKKSEYEWTQAIFRRERENERRIAKTQILDTFRTLGVERFS